MMVQLSSFFVPGFWDENQVSGNQVKLELVWNKIQNETKSFEAVVNYSENCAKFPSVYCLKGEIQVSFKITILECYYAITIMKQIFSHRNYPGDAITDLQIQGI